MKSQTRIFLDKVAVPTPVGFVGWEHDHPTTLAVTVELFSARTRWADAGGVYRLEHLIDYSGIHEHLMGWEGRAHTDSLEELCEALLAFCFADLQVEACRVCIVKPNIYANAAGAGVEITRTRDDHGAAAPPVED